MLSDVRLFVHSSQVCALIAALWLTSKSSSDLDVWKLGGLAEAPPVRPMIRNRQSGGIGQAGRFDYDPSSRRSKGIGLELPEFIQAPRYGFPLLVQPLNANKNLSEYGRLARKLIDNKLRQSEAMLFHGLPIRNADDFSQLMIGMDYPPLLSHGASERPQVAPLVYAASDDVPANFTLHPHNEQAYLSANEEPRYTWYMHTQATYYY